MIIMEQIRGKPFACSRLQLKWQYANGYGHNSAHFGLGRLTESTVYYSQRNKIHLL